MWRENVWIYFSFNLWCIVMSDIGSYLDTVGLELLNAWAWDRIQNQAIQEENFAVAKEFVQNCKSRYQHPVPLCLHLITQVGRSTLTKRHFFFKRNRTRSNGADSGSQYNVPSWNVYFRYPTLVSSHDDPKSIFKQRFTPQYTADMRG